MIGDVLSGTAALSPALWLSADAHRLHAHISVPTLCLLAATALTGLLGLLGFYNGLTPGSCERFRRRTLAVAALMAGGVVAKGLTAATLGLALLTMALLLGLGHTMSSLMRRLLTWLGLWGARTIVIGAGNRGQTIAEALRERPELGLRPVGFGALPEDVGPETATHLPVLATPREAGSLLGAEVAVLTSRSQLASYESEAEMGAPRALLIEEPSALEGLHLADAGAVGHMERELGAPPHSHLELILKRLFDLAVCLPALVLLSPLIAALAIAVKLADRGPAFFTQERIGRHGRPIQILKIRTMYTDAAERLEAHLRDSPEAAAHWQRYFKLDDDPRVLPVVGHVLRRFSLDELPQLWNVVRGEMSLVGPRPFPAYHLQSFNERFRTLRQSVPPGLTGLWQVSSRSDGDLNDQEIKDRLYIARWSNWLDLYILLRTLPAVVAGRGAK